MSPEGEEIREYFVGNIAVPVGEKIGVRVRITHTDQLGHHTYTTVLVNIGPDTDIEFVIAFAMALAEAGYIWRNRPSKQMPPVTNAEAVQLVIGGFEGELVQEL